MANSNLLLNSLADTVPVNTDPAEAEILIEIRRFHEGNFEEGIAALNKGFKMQRDNNWAGQPVMKFLLDRLLKLCSMFSDDELKQLFNLLEPLLPSGCFTIRRQYLLLYLSTYLDDDYKRRALVCFQGIVPPVANQIAIAAELPEREDCREALEKFYQLGGKLSEHFAAKHEPGPGLSEFFKALSIPADGS